MMDFILSNQKMDKEIMEHNELSTLNNDPTLRMRTYNATRDGASTKKENGVNGDYHDNHGLEHGDGTVSDIESAPSSHFENLAESHKDSERILQNETTCLGEPTEASVSRDRNSGDKELIQLDIEEKTEKHSKDLNFRDWTREQIIVLIANCLTNLLSFLSLSVLAPFFPLEANKKGVTDTVSGWIFGVFSLVQVFASPVCGYLIPILGSKFMFVAGAFISGGCTLVFGVLNKVDTSESTVTFVALCILTRVLLSLGCTALFNASLVIQIKLFPNNFGTVFGLVEVFSGVGLIAGPALGGALYTAGGFFTPFGVIAAGWCVSIPLVWYFIPRQDDTPKDENGNFSLKSLICYPKTLVNSLALVVSAIVWAVLDPTFEPHLRLFDIGPAMVGLLLLIMGLTYSVTSPLWGLIADRLTNFVRSLLMVSLVVCAVGMLLVGPSPLLGFQLPFNALWLTIISLVIIGIGASMSIIPTYNVYVEVLTELGYPEDTKTYGIVSGLWLSMFALGDFLGPCIGGVLSDEIGFEWLTTVIAGICIFTVIVIGLSWFIETKLRAKPKEEQYSVITQSGNHPYQTLN